MNLFNALNGHDFGWYVLMAIMLPIVVWRLVAEVVEAFSARKKEGVQQ